MILLQKFQNGAFRSVPKYLQFPQNHEKRSPVAVRSVFIYEIIMIPTDALLTYTSRTKGLRVFTRLPQKSFFAFKDSEQNLNANHIVGAILLMFNLFFFSWSTEC